MVNFPADVRKNLKGIILPQDKKETDTKQEEAVKTNKVDESFTKADNDDDEGNLSQGREVSVKMINTKNRSCLQSTQTQNNAFKGIT